MSPLPRVAALALLLVVSIAQAQLSQEPLFNRVSPVQPNLTLLMDDSTSMREEEIYEYGKPDGLGPRGPGAPKPPAIYYGRYSPDVNRLYYDPRVRYQPRPDFNGTPLALKPLINTWSIYFRKTTGPYAHGQLTAASDYHDPYVPPAALVVSGSTASYPVNVTAGTPAFTPFPKFVDRTDCLQPKACSLAEEQRNYTIWHQWYRTRLDMAKTGVALAFLPIKDNSIRLAFGTITGVAKHKRLDRGVAPFDTAPGGTKQQFFDWLDGIKVTGGTPNIRAVFNTGKYYERTDSDGPWGSTPDPKSTGIDAPGAVRSSENPKDHATCRRSFAMLVTDGYWNDSITDRHTGRSKKEADQNWTIRRHIKGDYFVYVPKKPYKRGPSDKSENTLSDVAMHFWGRDLRTDMDNNVPELTTSAGKNESAWQNMSFYAVTLGMRGTLVRDTTTWAKLNDPSDPLYWPEPQPGTPTTIDDTWHAAVNGHGDILNADNSSELSRATKRMLQGISGTPQTLAGVAVSSSVAQVGLRKYKPEYLSGTWTGNLTSIKLDPATGKELTTNWKVEDGVDPITGDPKSTIPATGRKIVTWSGSTSVPFTAANTSLPADLVAYLSGDSSKELRRAGGIFRNRESRLGDIVNSNPVFVRGTLDANYDALTGAGAPPAGSYKAFVAAKAARAGAIFVGANDGMLHGFDDRDGKEIFAYVPKAVWPKLAELADTPYQHRYFVDGPNVEADAYLSGNWTNLLLGTTGAGAKAVYAVDVTTPLAPQVKWEISSGTPGFSQMGHVLSTVQTGILQNGRWVAIFGNGYESSGGTSRLYVVDLGTGTLLHDIAAGTGPGNGLGPVTVVHDDKRRIIGAYAGDLHGSMWKFDLTSPVPASSRLYEPASPLPRHPITAAPAVLPHPKGGHVVTFGTGKFFEDADARPPYQTESLYGVWDIKPFDVPAVPVKGGTPSLTRQTVTTVQVGARNFARIPVSTLTWGNGTAGVRGWYMDLPNKGQRLVYPVQRLRGTFVLASTMSPDDDTTRDICSQTGGGRGWSYIIDGVTGSGVSKPALDTNSDGVINGHDQVLSGYEHGADGNRAVLTLGTNRRYSDFNFLDSGAKGEAVKISCGQTGADACPTRSRQWRQIFPRSAP